MSARLTPQPRRAPRPRRQQLRFPHADRFLRRLHGSLHPNASAPPPGAHRRDVWSWLVRWLEANTFAPRWMPARLRQPLLGYLFALLLELLAASVTLLLIAQFPLFTFHAMLMLFSVVVIALGWGAGPGLWATLIGAVLTCYALLPPSFSWKFANPADALGLGFSVLVGASFSLLVSRSERARRQMEALTEHLAQAQAKSEANCRRLQSVLEVLPVGVFLADATGRLLDTNPASRAIWGETAPLVHTTAEYGAYQGWWPGTEVRLAPEDWALARALQKGETTLQEEIDIQTFAGQRKTILNNAVPVRDATGAITGGVVAILDISERKRLEEALRQAEREAAARARELEAIFEALTDGLLVYDAEGRILRSNPAARQLLGFEAQPWFDSLSWQERFSRYAARDEQGQPIPLEQVSPARLLRGEVLTSAQPAEECLETPDGREVTFSVTGQPLRDAAGTIIGAVIIGRDETERRRLEREVAARARELEAIFEALTDGLVVLDAEGRILRSNTAARQILGFEAHPEFLTLSFQERATRYASRDTEGQPVPPEDLATARLLRGEVLISAQAAEQRIETPDGREVTLSSTGRPLRNAEGMIIGAVGIMRDVTERRRLEREVAERAAQLETIFESIADGVVVTDRQERVLHMNQAARNLIGLEDDPTGWTPRQLAERAGLVLDDEQGKTFPETQTTFSRYLRGEVLTNQQSGDLTLHMRDGREARLNYAGAPIRDATGQIIGSVEVIRDVTERRRLEQQVTEHAAQLEAILESIADGVVVTDRQEQVLHMNQAARNLIGLEDDPTGWTLLQLDRLAGFAGYTPAGQRLTEADDPFPRVLQGEVLTNEQSLDAIIWTRAGRETWINTTGAPIRDAGGQVLGSVFVSRNVTEQRRLEQQTRETLNALLAMAEALVQAPEPGSAALAEGAPEPNHVARRLAELTRRVLDCRYVGIAAVEPGTGRMAPITLVGVSPEQEQQWWASWEAHGRLGQHLSPGQVAALHAGEPILVTNVHTLFPRGRDLVPGGPSVLVPMRMIDTLVGILRVEGKTPEEAQSCLNRKDLIGAVARLGAFVLERERLLRERTEARANELALRETQAQMETFLGMAGHELKTPLTSLKLALQLVERRISRLAQNEPDRAHLLASLLDHATRAGLQSTRLERLVNELLDVSRVRAGKLELHSEPADLAAIVGEAVEEQRQAHPERTLAFQFGPQRTVPVMADADRIGQVVTNYLTNALKYSPEDRPVEVGLDEEEGQARVWVRDLGPGLPPEEQTHIWERFHRVKDIEVQSGTGVGLGLGLYICRMIVERHLGQVGVQSTPGQGSTFWFTLPLGSEPEEGGPAPG